MSRADDLRAQLALVEAEEDAVETLRAARAAYLADPDDPDTGRDMRHAADQVRGIRVRQRTGRDATARPATITVTSGTGE